MLLSQLHVPSLGGGLPFHAVWSDEPRVSLTLDLLISDYQGLLAVARVAWLYDWYDCPCCPHL